MAIEITIASENKNLNIHQTLIGLADVFNKTINATFHVSYMKRNLILKELSKGDLRNQGVDVLFGIISLEALNSPGYRKYELSSSTGNLDYVIISGEPVVGESNAISSILVIDFKVVTLILLFWIVISILLAFQNNLFTIKNHNTKNMLSNSLSWTWNLFKVFFVEPISGIPKSISAKLLIASWLFLSIVLFIYFGSFLKSDLSTYNYIKVDTVKDAAMFYPKAKLLTYRQRPGVRKRIKTWYPKVQTWEIIDNPENYYEFVDLGKIEFYKSILERQSILIVPYSAFEVEFCVNAVPNWPDNKTLYISKRAVEFQAKGFLYFKNLSAELREQMNIRTLAIIEYQPFRNSFAKCRFLIDKLTWTHPLIEDEPVMTLSDLEGIVIIWVYGLGLASLIFLLEKIFFKIGKRCK